MSTRARAPIAGHLVGTVILALAYASPASGQCTTRVSVASDGTQGDGGSYAASVSADGRYVAFDSFASNLVPDDTNAFRDVFVHDRVTGATTRVSVASNGTQGDWDSEFPSISADGRYVAFHSNSSNLVPDDTNWQNDVFVHDRVTGATTRVSVASDGTQGTWPSYCPSISGDGRFVVFTSGAPNLVPSDTNGKDDVFVHDCVTGATTRVSVASDGSQGDNNSGNKLPTLGAPSLSVDGRYVAFQSFASNLVPGDTNIRDDVFVHDRDSGATTRVSVASDGTQGNGESCWYGLAISADGRYVAFDSGASNLVPADTNVRYDVFVHDRQTGATTRVSLASDGTQGNGHSGTYGLSISADGRYVTFDSEASNLVPGDTNVRHDVLVHDRQTATTTRVSVSSAGVQGNNDSYYPSTSADGRFVAFIGPASNLVPGDTNGSYDVFVHDSNAACPLPGDLNCNGVVDFDDINPFVTALVSQAAYEARYPGCPWLNGDINGDGAVDFDDINPFVRCLVGGGCP